MAPEIRIPKGNSASRDGLKADKHLHQHDQQMNARGNSSQNVMEATESNIVAVSCDNLDFKKDRHSDGWLEGDLHMASWKAEESDSRRVRAVAWLQAVLGSLSLPTQPSEEELRLCLRNGLVLCNLLNKIHPSSVPQVLESSASFNRDNGALRAIQNFENVRSFLVAVEALNLPTFEASDLEKAILPAGSMAKVVDCVLALKSHCEWRDTCGDELKNVRKAFPQGLLLPSPVNGVQLPISWPLPDVYPQVRQKDSSEATSIHLENVLSQTLLSDSTTQWTSQLGDKVGKPRQKEATILHKLPGSDSRKASSVPDTVASNGVPALIRSFLGSKTSEELPLLVHYLLKKVTEEFERRLATQGAQVKRLKSTLKAFQFQNNKRVSHMKALETLATGSGEEIKLISSQLQHLKVEKKRIEEAKAMKEEGLINLAKIRDDDRMQIEALTKELENLKAEAKEQKHRLEFQLKLEQMSQTTIKELSLELEKAELKLRKTEVALELALGNKKNGQTEVYELRKTLTSGFEELKSAAYLLRQEVLQMKLLWQKEVCVLQSQLERITTAATGYHKVLAENRMLYNEVQDLKGNIRVYCRVRPFIGGQISLKGLVTYIGENGEISIRNPCKQGKGSSKAFKFNRVYRESVSQEEVYNDARPLIRSVLDGYNVCIFAYGQTGSGKTYTMSGPTNISEEVWGVNYRALNDLFQICQIRREVFSYEVGVQMIEIYNEQVRDLLSQDNVQKRLEIRNSSQINGLNVPDAGMMPVKSTDDVLELMRIGLKNRAIGATALNERSSRSHCVLTVHVQGMDMTSGCVLRGCLHLVDLAGSERVDKSEAIGERLREAQHINKSLSALGDVISALSQKNAHIPYRNSKLTQLLQESLGGQAKALMFVHISQDKDSYGETISTLKFAERVASVELGAARSTKETGEARDLREQINFLQEILAQKEEDITKRDMEIERLHGLEIERCSPNEFSLHHNRPAITIFSSTPESNRLEAHMPGLSSDTVALVEGSEPGHAAASRNRQKLSFTERTAQGHVMCESDESSPKLCPPSYLAPEYITENAGSSKISHSESVSSNSQFSPRATSVSLNQTKQKVHELMLDREANRKVLADRMQMDSDALFATASSVDEEARYSDSASVLRIDDECRDPQAFVCSPKESWTAPSHSSYASGGSEFSQLLTAAHLAAENPRSSRSMTEAISETKPRNNSSRQLGRSLSSQHFQERATQADTDDRMSEFSEGLYGEADTAMAAADSVAAAQLLQRKPNIRNRSQLHGQKPRPASRHERKLSDGAISHAQSIRRQLSVAVGMLRRER